jgi:AcrR family transcriptional regulator
VPREKPTIEPEAEPAPATDTTRVTKKRPEWEAPTAVLGPGATPSAPTARGRRTERALLEAGRTIIARDGYGAAKIADIASLAGTAMGSFYTYFEGKEKLLVALAVDFQHDIRKRFAAVSTVRRGIEEIMRDLVACYWDAYVAHAPVLAGIHQAAAMSPEVAATWRSLRADSRRQLTASIELMQAHGQGMGIDPDATSSALCAMMDGFCRTWIVGGGESDRDTIDRQVAIETLAAIWYRTVAFRAEGEGR